MVQQDIVLFRGLDAMLTGEGGEMVFVQHRCHTPPQTTDRASSAAPERRGDGLRRELAGLVLRLLRLSLVLWLLWRDGEVLAMRHNGTSLLRRRVRCADLYQLRFGGDGVGNRCVHLCLLAA